jgi:hypothetical protein
MVFQASLSCPLRVCVLLAVALSAAACTKEPQQVSWTIAFSDPTLQDRASAVEAAILSGGCANNSVAPLYDETLSLSGSGGATSRPPTLSPGVYGVRTRARDATCVVYAEGCEEVTFPLANGAITVTMQPVATETAACPSSQCTQGLCVSAGLDDGGTTPVDGSTPVDGGSDAATDGASDANTDASTDSGTDGSTPPPVCGSVSVTPAATQTGSCPDVRLTLGVNVSYPTGCTAADYTFDWRITSLSDNVEWFTLSGNGAAAASGGNVQSGTYAAPLVNLNVPSDADRWVEMNVGDPAAGNNTYGLYSPALTFNANASYNIRFWTFASNRSVTNMLRVSLVALDGSVFSQSSVNVNGQSAWTYHNVSLVAGASVPSPAFLVLSFWQPNNTYSVVNGDRIGIDEVQVIRNGNNLTPTGDFESDATLGPTPAWEPYFPGGFSASFRSNPPRRIAGQQRVEVRIHNGNFAPGAYTSVNVAGSPCGS